MKHLFLAISLLFGTSPLFAQAITVHFNIAPEQDTFLISPYIYGSNGQSDDSTANITALRLGGNRLSGYNWETGASNAGTDYLNQSDDYLTYQLPQADQSKLGIVPIAFQQQAKKIGAYTLSTLPAAGYVAADESGVVSAAETAPSARWRQVVYQKGAPYSMTPDLTDGFVYDDEEVNYLVKTLGASNAGGIQGYDCDNEPALWPSTHPRIHPNQTTCAEVISRDSAVALAVKSVDPHAEVFGPVCYGFEEYYNNQAAPDWDNYSSYGRWLDAYLAKMHAAEIANGKRLLDVLDLHFYSDAQGYSSTGQLTDISSSDEGDPGIARARMDAPRSLWDSSYTENSWIGQNFSPVALLRWFNAAIAQYYPGTKLSFSEFDYGGEHQISGAIATADVFGIFGKYHVYMANHWGTVDSYLASAYKIFRNYDGNNGAYGDIGGSATTDNIDSTSIYVARRTNDPDHLDIIAINKSEAASATANVAIKSATSYTSARAFMLQQSSPALSEAAPIASITANSFTFSLPALSITHFVLARANASVSSQSIASHWSIKSAVATSVGVKINLEGTLGDGVQMELRDVLGRTLAQSSVSSPTSSHASLTLPVHSLANGAYFVEVRSGGITQGWKLIEAN
jgi:hypothetical protein